MATADSVFVSHNKPSVSMVASETRYEGTHASGDPMQSSLRTDRDERGYATGTLAESRLPSAGSLESTGTLVKYPRTAHERDDFHRPRDLGGC